MTCVGGMKMNILKNKTKKNIKGKFLAMLTAISMTAGLTANAFADSGEVVTLGANLKASRKLKYNLCKQPTGKKVPWWNCTRGSNR